MNDTEIISGFGTWCIKHSISSKNILVVTVQENRSTKYSSLVIDFANDRILPNYPAEMLTDYKECREGKYLVCYKENLQLPEAFDAALDMMKSLKLSDRPLPSGHLVPYKPTRTQHDQKFSDFIKGKGDYPDVVFEVKTQVNNGPLLHTKYFCLCNDEIREVHGSFTNKLHSFKNFKCPSENLFIGIDLYTSQEGYNYHHMRLNPFTKVEPDVLRDFLDVAGVLLKS